MGPANMSRCESFQDDASCGCAANRRNIGETSAGTSGNPKPSELENGVTVFLPSYRVMDLKENMIARMRDRIASVAHPGLL